MAVGGIEDEFGLQQSPSVTYSQPLPALSHPEELIQQGKKQQKKKPQELLGFFEWFFWAGSAPGTGQHPSPWSTRVCRSHIPGEKGWARASDAKPWPRSLPPTADFPCDLRGFGEGSFSLKRLLAALGRQELPSSHPAPKPSLQRSNHRR